MWTSPNGGAAVMVAGTRAPDVSELWDWRLGPGDVHRSEAHRSGTHELLLVRAGGHGLPLRRDNLTVDEERLKPRTIGTLEDIRPGTRRTWNVVLARGRYVLFCNMSGHYLGGMRRLLVVR